MIYSEDKAVRFFQIMLGPAEQYEAITEELVKSIIKQFSPAFTPSMTDEQFEALAETCMKAFG